MQQNFYKNVFIKIKIRLVMFSNLNLSSFQHIRSKFESSLYFIEYTLIYRKIHLNIFYIFIKFWFFDKFISTL